MPLLVEGSPIGVIAFYFTAPVNFDDEYRALLVSVAQDCAQALDRARLYESAQKARAEAESANRLKDEFVSIVSHELRAPLNAILGWTAMLRRDDLDKELATRALQSVHDNATRQARLIEELLDFSRVSSGRLALERTEIEVRELLRGVVESLIPDMAAKGVSLDFPPAPPARVAGDRSRLEQVFFNLLGNALKFTPAGGQISVTVAEQEQEVEVRVADSGVGIEPEFLPFVFERFKQGDNAGGREFGGLGLGLSIARQLVEAHEGRIAVESRGKGQGATFTVRLPVVLSRA
jgi:signal transduction histidine kinase